MPNLRETRLSRGRTCNAMNLRRQPWSASDTIVHPLLASVALRSSMCTLHLVLTRHLEDAFSALVKKSIRLIAIRRTRSPERVQDHGVPNFRISTVTVLSTFWASNARSTFCRLVSRHLVCPYYWVRSYGSVFLGSEKTVWVKHSYIDISLVGWE